MPEFVRQVSASQGIAESCYIAAVGSKFAEHFELHLLSERSHAFA